MFKSAKLGISTLLPVLSFATIVLFVSFPAATGAVSSSVGLAKVSPTPETPAYSGYKGVTIGTAMADTRAKLGKARDMSDYEDYYVVADNETVQIQYDTDKTVKTISVNFIGANPAAPAAKAVFGADAEARPDGGVFKMVRYPKAGYWVSYNKTTGDNAMVVVTVQKIPSAQLAVQ